ncbi:Hypothetical_protein [Hexamita inflata]|uniref:Hypothetical_protein n=1 Tax=Hexamita inflata TaxID=28002 RepID=A0AA86USB8_9EUKA|nr:Hypothetical protein HINF_LOCUS50627 [Hexamita inflata]
MRNANIAEIAQLPATFGVQEKLKTQTAYIHQTTKQIQQININNIINCSNTINRQVLFKCPYKLTKTSGQTKQIRLILQCGIHSQKFKHPVNPLYISTSSKFQCQKLLRTLRNNSEYSMIVHQAMQKLFKAHLCVRKFRRKKLVYNCITITIINKCSFQSEQDY